MDLEIKLGRDRIAARAHRKMVRSVTVPGPGQNVAQIGRFIPAPAAPVEPVLSVAAFIPVASSPIHSVLDIGDAIELSAGRFAIARAFKLMGLKKGDKVLVPAFHCSSMVEPLSVVGADPIFYRLKEDLSFDIEDIRAKLSPEIRCILATHYFGFPQPLVALRKLCDEAKIVLMEDCAHSFFGDFGEHMAGSLGDYVIASPRKFFPVPDGGYLFQRKNSGKGLSPVSDTFLSDWKKAFNFVEQSLSYGRLALAAPIIKLLSYAVKYFRRGRGKFSFGESVPDMSQNNPDAYGNFDASRINTKMTFFSRLTCRISSKGRMIQGRRNNYMKLLRGVEGLQGCRPLRPILPEGVVPHMFPLWVKNLDTVFPKLEDLAIPMQRFGQFLSPGIDETMCPISSEMSHHLVQFPCHQELSTREIEWIISNIRSVLAMNVPRAKCHS